MANLKGASSIYNRTRHRLETVVYRTLGGGQGIQNITTQTWDNADGESLRVIAKRLLKATSKKKVMFVITDGKPFLNDADTACLDQDLKNTLEWAKRSKIEVYGLGFNDVPKSFYGDNYCKVESMDVLLKFLKERLIVVV
jgi:cobalamin biosynthesis protein CobT